MCIVIFGDVNSGIVFWVKIGVGWNLMIVLLVGNYRDMVVCGVVIVYVYLFFFCLFD